MHFTNDDMKNQIIGNDGNVYELDVRGGQPSEEKECKCPSEYVPSGDCPLHGEPSEESVTEIEIGSKVAPHSEESWEVDLSQLLTKYGIRFELESGKTLKQALEQFFRRVIQAERQKVIEEIESLDETKDLIKYLEANYEVKLWINILDELKGRKGK